MTDETDTTSAVARVLGEHYPDQTSYDAGDLHGCHCGWEVPRPRSNDTDDWEAYWAHQAAMLAEAGLLREAADSAEPCASEVWSMDYYRDGQVDPYWIRCNVLGPHTEHEDANTGLTWTTDDPEEAQIATQEPAEQPRTDPAGRGASGGLGERLRAADLIPSDKVRAFADEAHRLEVHARVVEQSLRRVRGDVERVRAQFARMTKSSDEKTVRHGTALLHILDGTDAP